MIVEVAAMVAAEPRTATPILAPEFGNSPDSGRPPVEQFPRPIPDPRGRPDTTAPTGLRRGSPSAGHIVINPSNQLPFISVEPGTEPRPELITSLVLQRAHSGAVAKFDGNCLDRGLPTPGDLAGVFDELTAAGLLVLADPDPYGLQQPQPVPPGPAPHRPPSPPARPVTVTVSSPAMPREPRHEHRRVRAGRGPRRSADRSARLRPLSRRSAPQVRGCGGV